MGDLTKNFSRSEFVCRCGCGFDDVNPDLVKKLQQLRDRIGKPLYINSGCRCAKHNEAVRGARNSYHLRGMAALVAYVPITPLVAAALCIGLLTIQLMRMEKGPQIYSVTVWDQAHDWTNPKLNNEKGK